jgi:hypothetical protein
MNCSARGRRRRGRDETVEAREAIGAEDLARAVEDGSVGAGVLEEVESMRVLITQIGFVARAVRAPVSTDGVHERAAKQSDGWTVPAAPEAKK